ncbi:prolyl oligopeptidase family serine peptidase [archaeon]|nr:prolyl oligopeptidase family serine peptidase [archaeon]
MERDVYFSTTNNDKLLGKIRLANSSDQEDDPLSQREMVILSHSYGSHLDSKTTMQNVATALSDRGIDSLRYSFWGCKGSEGDFKKNTITQYIKDLESAITFSKTLGYHNISLYGFSCGGHVALNVAKNDPSIKKVAVVGAVLDYPAQRARRLSEIVMQTWEREGVLEFPNYGGAREVEYSFIEDASQHILLNKDATINELARIHCPVLLLHGTEDREVPYSQSQRAADHLSNSTLQLYQGDDHWLRGNYQNAAENIAKWFSE